MNGHANIDIETEVKTKTTVNVNGHNLNEVLDLACDLSHEILEQISVLRNQGRIGETEDLPVEGMACRFLDMVGD